MNIEILTVSVGVGAAIGYITNYFAIKMLFRPYKAVKIGNITFFPQGIIPREKKTLAKKVGEVVKDYILSENEIKKIVTSKEVHDEIEKFLNEKVENMLDKDIQEFVSKEEIAEKFALIIENIIKEKFSMFAGFISKDTLKDLLIKLEIPLKINQIVSPDMVKDVLKKEVFNFLENEVPTIFIKARIDKIVEEKVASFDEKTLEDMLFVLMKKHFGFINFAGAILGGIIGFIQYFVIK